jgi:hypothetical protein
MLRFVLSFSRLAHRSSCGSAGLAAAADDSVAVDAAVAEAAANEADGLVRLLHSGSTLPLRARCVASSTVPPLECSALVLGLCGKTISKLNLN